MNLEDIHSYLMFVPNKEFYTSPEKGTYEDVFIKTNDGEKLHGYFFPSKENTKNVLIYLHGNADNVSSWYTACTEIQRRLPINALIIDYRGYGKSTGKPSRLGVINDAISMYDFILKKGFNSEDIVLLGRSLGGGVALELAKRKKVKSIIIQSSFTSVKNVAKHIYPFIPDFLIRNDLFNSIESIKEISVPVLFTHGDLDTTIPVSHSYKLFEAANNPKNLIIHKGAGHNDISSFFNEEYHNALKSIVL